MELKILILDDEYIILDGLCSFPWEMYGCRIVGKAMDGEEGMELIDRYQPDIILSDIKMPEKDGIQVAKYAKEKYPDTEIILLTGYDSFSYAQQAITIGVADYLLKPVNFREMHEVIGKTCKKIRKNQFERHDYYELQKNYQKALPEIRAKLISDAQVLMSAVSDDLLKWEKNGKFVLPAPEGYDGNDWRDPFILWEEESQQYIMILGARKIDKKKVRTGRTVWFTSKNLNEWKFEGDFWAPDLFSMHEMPDLFKMGDWWYLLTTEYSERSKTVYRMSHSLNGPWSAPIDDAFDGRAYYAARSCSDGEHRYLFGWAATKTGADDMNSWDWGGTFVCHEVYQRPDGTLGVKLPDCMLPAFKTEDSLSASQIEMKTLDSLQEHFITNVSENFYMIEMDIAFSEHTRMFGIRLCEDAETGDAYKFEANLAENRIYFDRTPNQPWYRYFDKGLERPLYLKPNQRYHIRVIVDDTIAVIYIDGVALTTRMYAKAGQGVNVYVVDGNLTVDNIKITK